MNMRINSVWNRKQRTTPTLFLGSISRIRIVKFSLFSYFDGLLTIFWDRRAAVSGPSCAHGNSITHKRSKLFIQQSESFHMTIFRQDSTCQQYNLSFYWLQTEQLHPFNELRNAVLSGRVTLPSGLLPFILLLPLNLSVWDTRNYSTLHSLTDCFLFSFNNFDVDGIAKRWYVFLSVSQV